MIGVLNINKPTGITSFGVISKMRKILNEKKIGHAGTLDPDASGVLPIFIGKATKALQYANTDIKSYTAELTLGIKTNTQDASGEIISEKKVHINTLEITNIIKSFIGEQEQLPPMYSAVKIKGKKLYELARQGIEIERKKRWITIYNIDILCLNLERDNPIITFEVKCSKGTYIRALCNDIGEKALCGGHMSNLIRTKAGMFTIDNAYTIEEIELAVKENTLNNCLIPIDEIFTLYKSLCLNQKQLKRFRDGIHIKMNNEDYIEEQILRIYNEDNQFVALGKTYKQENNVYIKHMKFFI